MTFFASWVFSSIVLFFIIGIGIAAFIVSFFQKVEQGKALIVNTMKSEPVVTFTGRVVLPVIHKAETMDISLKTIEIDRRGKDGLICRDNIRADIKVTFFVRVNKTAEDVLKVAQAIGCVRASDPATLEELFNAKFSEALKTVGKQLDFEDLYKERDSFRDQIIELIGTHLNGYVLEDAAIDFLEQTPLSSLDPDNILDAQGIRKITELTSQQHVFTNEFENQEKLKITQQNVNAREAILEMERRQADAEAKQQREIQNVKDREAAEIALVASQEKRRSEEARLEMEEQVAIRDENKRRELEVAEQNRLRVVSIEQERVKLAREQESIAREREVELQRIAKEKALEVEKREIANVIRERIAVEKTVAEEEERIKELRMVEEAKRMKQVTIITAEAEAEEALVKDIKQAEAQEQAATHKAQEQLIMAEAEREISDKRAAAKIRLAEGVQAESAAAGLAQVRVKEANALAIEKEGIAQAKAMLEKMQAEAAGIEQKGLAEVRVKEANAQAIEKEGIAQAKALQEKMQAEAIGAEQQGMAQVRIQEHEADVIEKKGLAEAKALQEKLLAEAGGLVEKFKALDALSGDGKAHEEFRLQLEQQLKLNEAAIQGQKVIAEHQATVLAQALQSAKIDIIGGDQLFFERLINATSLAKSLDGFIDKSDTARTVLRDYLAQDASLIQDIKQILSNPAMSSQDIQHLTLSAFLGKLITHADGAQKNKLSPLLEWVEKHQLGNVSVAASD